MDNTDKIAHLGFIQAVISRMGNNSFLLKGWSVTLVAALFVLSAKDSNSNFILIAYIPVVAFWVLDSYFLNIERRYRNLYDKVRRNEILDDDFTMDLSVLDKIDEEKSKGKKKKETDWKHKMHKMKEWFKARRSDTLLLFHGALLIVLIVATVIVCLNKSADAKKQVSTSFQPCGSSTVIDPK